MLLGNKRSYFSKNLHSADVTQIMDIFEKFQPEKFSFPNFPG
jgi:hypothetical protein